MLTNNMHENEERGKNINQANQRCALEKENRKRMFIHHINQKREEEEHEIFI